MKPFKRLLAGVRCTKLLVVGGSGSSSSGSGSGSDWGTIEQEAVKQFSSVVCFGGKSFVLKIQGEGFSVTKEDSVQFCLYFAAEAAEAAKARGDLEAAAGAAKTRGDLEVAAILNEKNAKMKKQYLKAIVEAMKADGE
jgi:hypothetical protein